MICDRSLLRFRGRVIVDWFVGRAAAATFICGSDDECMGCEN